MHCFLLISLLWFHFSIKWTYQIRQQIHFFHHWCAAAAVVCLTLTQFLHHLHHRLLRCREWFQSLCANYWLTYWTSTTGTFQTSIEWKIIWMSIFSHINKIWYKLVIWFIRLKWPHKKRINEWMNGWLNVCACARGCKWMYESVTQPNVGLTG